MTAENNGDILTEDEELDDSPVVISPTERINYIRKNQSRIVSWWGLRYFDIHRQVRIAGHIQEIRRALRHKELAFAELGIGRLEWCCRVWWSRKHRFFRLFYVKAQTFMVRRFPHWHRPA